MGWRRWVGVCQRRGRRRLQRPLAQAHCLPTSPLPRPRNSYTIQTGGLYGSDSVAPPFVAGHDGVAVVVKARRCAGCC